MVHIVPLAPTSCTRTQAAIPVATAKLGMGDGRQVSKKRHNAFLPKFSTLFLSSLSISLVATKFWIRFQSSEKVDSDIFFFFAS